MPSSIALPAKPGSARRISSWSGFWSSSSTAFAIVDSTVSMAPNRITRSCATISSSESPRAGSLATALVIELSGRVRERCTSSSRIAFERGARACRRGAAARDRRRRPWRPRTPRRTPARARRRRAGGRARRPRARSRTAPRTPRRARTRRAGRAAPISASMWRCTGSAKRSRTGRTRNGSSNGCRCRACSAPSLVSIITPSDARTRFGSAQTVKSSPRLSSSRASSCEVTSQPPSAGTHEIGSKSRRRSSAADAAVELEIGELDARSPIGKRALRAAASASSITTCRTSSPIRRCYPAARSRIVGRLVARRRAPRRGSPTSGSSMRIAPVSGSRGASASSGTNGRRRLGVVAAHGRTAAGRAAPRAAAVEGAAPLAALLHVGAAMLLRPVSVRSVASPYSAASGRRRRRGRRARPGSSSTRSRSTRRR